MKYLVKYCVNYETGSCHDDKTSNLESDFEANSNEEALVKSKEIAKKRAGEFGGSVNPASIEIYRRIY